MASDAAGCPEVVLFLGVGIRIEEAAVGVKLEALVAHNAQGVELIEDPFPRRLRIRPAAQKRGA